MTYVTKRCPHCDYPYVIGAPKKSGYYGSPIRVCSKCQKRFVDKDYREIALSGVRRIDRKGVSFRTAIGALPPLFFFLVGVLGLMCWGFDEEYLYLAIGGAIFSSISIWLIWDEAKKFPDRQAYLQMEAIRSESRLSDPNYAKALQRLGYSIPVKYLNGNHSSRTSGVVFVDSDRGPLFRAVSPAEVSDPTRLSDAERKLRDKIIIGLRSNSYE